MENLKEGKVDEAEQFAYSAIPPDKHSDFRPVWKFCVKAPVFNPDSADDMKLFLFDVKKFTPVKTTNQKAIGKPSMDWGKVLELPEDKQKEYTPSVDKQTIEILANHYKDKLLHKLLEFKSVATVCKSFLGEPIIDEDTGEVLEEKGLHSFITPDDTLLSNTSATETGRPRLTINLS